ncbi:hypothetical protein SeLEV6574_g04242 [Synchytrium endobioticum]|nr:hypothetical protein SeLEV6574_g04242 [Synchytrium endobioticum]
MKRKQDQGQDKARADSEAPDANHPETVANECYDTDSHSKENYVDNDDDDEEHADSKDVNTEAAEALTAYYNSPEYKTWYEQYMTWAQYQQQQQQSSGQYPQTNSNGTSALDSLLDRIDSKVKTTLDATVGSSSSNSYTHAYNTRSIPDGLSRDEPAAPRPDPYTDYSQMAHFNTRTGRFTAPQSAYPSQAVTVGYEQHNGNSNQPYYAPQATDTATYYDPNSKAMRQMSHFFDVNAYQEQMQAQAGKAKGPKKLTKAELDAIKQRNQARKKAKLLKEYGGE